ncbi:MAG: archaea-specific SMC-related protein, partial [Halodesulfurarchaeum sp.]
LTLSPGVTVLEGENASNRTSFLRSIMAALGSDQPSLKADATTGHVELTLDGETYTRTLERTNTGVRTGGDPYLDDPTLADDFAFLLETNPARQAVTRQDDLRPVIMDPIDTAAIQAEITRKTTRRSQIDEQLAELDDLRDRRPELEEKRTQIETDIEEKREELSAVESEIAEAEVDVAETSERKAALESAFEEVQQLRTELDSVTDRLRSERENLADAREERASLEDEREGMPESLEERRREIESELSTLREEKSRLESEMSEIQNLVQFNEGHLEEDDTLLEPREETEDVTDRLVDTDAVTCWTCGSTVERAQIESTIDRLRELRSSKLEEVQALESDIESLQSELTELESRVERREEIEREQRSLAQEIEDREQSIAELETRRDELEAAIEDAEADIEAMEFAENHEALLDLHHRANRLELEIERLQEERADVEEELSSIADRLEHESELEAEREAIAEELSELRTRVDRIEREAVEEFNGRMEEILDVMDYANIARIWIERRDQDRDGDPEFELHVIRNDATGTAYEDTIEHLSESEREVTGLVFALAGYLVHDVSETVPFMLVDSVEALDSDRIARLVSYFEDHAPYLVIALLPEDARALDESYRRITEI